MTIQASEIQDLLKQANPASPDAPSPTEAVEVQQNAPLSPQGQGGTAALSSRPAQSPTSAVPARSFSADTLAPGSFSQKFFDAFKTLATSGKPISFPTMALAASAHAGSAPDATAQGSTTWDAAQKNDQTQPTTAPPPPPARGGAATAVSGIKNVTANLGDAAAATSETGAGGFFGGFARAAGARTQRSAQEMKDREAMAVANAQMIHEQALTHKIGEDQIAAATQSGQAGMNLLLKSHIPGTLLYSDKTSDQIHDMLKVDPATGKSQIDPSVETVFLTGRIQTGTDANGQPQFRSTYSVVRPGGPVTFSEENGNLDDLKYINDQLHMNIKPGQELPAVQVNNLWQQAQGREVAEAARNQSLAELGLKEAETNLKTESLGIGKDPLVQQALAKAGGPGEPYRTVKAYNLLMNDPQFLKDHPSFPTTYAMWAGGGNAKNFDVMLDQYAKAQDKSAAAVSGILGEVTKDPLKIEGKTSSVLAAAKSIMNDPNKSDDEKKQAKRIYDQAQDVRQFEIDMEGAKELKKDEIKRSAVDRSNPNGLTGQAYINTLPIGRQNSLKAIYNGSLAINPAALERTDKGQAFMDDIYAAYPDFDAYKGMEWPKAYADAMAGGKVYQAKNNYNTALQHMDEIYRTSTWNGLFNPASKDYQDRHAAIPIVIGEMVKAVKAGVATIDEQKAFEKALSGAYKTPGDAQERAAEQTRLLMEKIDEYQNQFQQAAPSAAIKVPTLLSPAAKKAYDYVQSGGKAPAAPQYKVGQTFNQNGHQFTIRSLNPDGSIKDAD